MTDINETNALNRPRRIIEVIEPNTARVLELRRLREEQER